MLCTDLLADVPPSSLLLLLLLLPLAAAGAAELPQEVDGVSSALT
jgi:hypothetical protein